ncbi:MAG: lipopolysaccharide heptosyltransferase II [Pseudomonadales bacterium]|nr:lipopolysaccharide heptosyltransferase II [Pseudomonadales bacterium]
MNILVVGPSWVGDMVMAQSLFMLLAKNDPELAIDVLAPAWSLPLLERMPEVRTALAMPVGHGQLQLMTRYRLGRALAEKAYQQAIVLPNSFKSALVPWFAGIPLRTGWRGEARSWLLNDCRVLDRKKYPLMMERFAALAVPENSALPTPLPTPALQVQAAGQEKARTKFSLSLSRPVLLVCPGAEFGASKQWPAQHYAAVAAAAIAQGRQIWLLGSANDCQVGAEIYQSLPGALREHCKDLTGRTTLAEAIDLMSLSQAVISNDSGLMHVAAALDRPLVVIYGSTSPAFTPPLARQARTLSLNLACSPCYKRRCPLSGTEHLKCLRELKPMLALEALRSLEH